METTMEYAQTSFPGSHRTSPEPVAREKALETGRLAEARKRLESRAASGARFNSSI